MAGVVYDGRAARFRRWMVRSGLAVGSALTLLVSSLLGGALFTSVIEASNPGSSLLMQKLIQTVGGRGPDAAIALIFLMASLWLRSKRIHLQQKEYDYTGERVLRDLRVDPAARVPDFYLYLRAFETTGRLHVPLYLRVRRKCVWVAQRLVTDDLESYVSVAVGSVAPLIALGRPGEAIGAGRILTEDVNWQKDIVTLMRRAKGILLVPSDRPGTVWEMEAMREEGLFTKVVFIMPPLTAGGYETSERWDAAKRVMAVHGLEAPEQQDRGMLFRVGPDGKLANAEPLLLNSPRKMRKSLQRIFKNEQGKRIYKAIVNTDQRARRAAFWGWLENGRQLSIFPVALLAVFLPTPNVGFDPKESWATVFDRFMTAGDMAKFDETGVLSQSAKYLTLASAVAPEKIPDLNQTLLSSGLPRIPVADLRAYYAAEGEMMSRVSDKTCAAIANGEIQPDAMQIALTYIPSDLLQDYLHARTSAIVASAEGTAPVTLDKNDDAEAWQGFAGSLDEKDSQRFQKINEAGTATADDKCWLDRTMWKAAGTLRDPQGTLWVRALAGLSAGESSLGSGGQGSEGQGSGGQGSGEQGSTGQDSGRQEAVAHGPAQQTSSSGSAAQPELQKTEPERASLTGGTVTRQRLADATSAIQANAQADPPPPPDPSIAMLERARAELDSGRLVEPSNDCALYWARQLTQNGNLQGVTLEQNILARMGKRISDARAAKNYPAAISDLNQLIAFYPERSELASLRSQIQNEQQREAAEAQLKKFVLQHRHILFANNGNMVQAYCVGVLMLAPDGTARFDCINSFDPQGRCDHLAFPRGAIKEVKFLKNGLLHVATNHMGNYDFYGESMALQGAYEGLGAMAGR